MAWNSGAKYSHYLFDVNDLHFSPQIQLYYLYILFCFLSLNLPSYFYNIFVLLSTYTLLYPCAQACFLNTSVSPSSPGYLAIQQKLKEMLLKVSSSTLTQKKQGKKFKHIGMFIEIFYFHCCFYLVLNQ